MLERAMNTVRGMEDVANWISDMDRSWWPFGFLRPVPDARISSFRVALIAMLYGVFAGMLANVLVDLGKDVLVGELDDLGFAERHPEVAADCFR